MEEDHKREGTELQFFGKIVAAATHEINNVLSIVNENTGLLADLLAAGGKKGVPKEKVNSINESIEKHLERGKNIISHLNRFAHSVDRETARVELEEVLQNMALLSERYTRQQKASIKLEPADGRIVLDTDAFVLRNAVFICLSSYLEGAEPGYEVIVSFGKENDTVALSFSGPVIKDVEDKKEILSRLMDELSGSLSFDTGAGVIKLYLPGSAPSSSSE
ncbi:MAG: hypothetical protein R6V10_13595 [bacterium]